MTTSRTRWLSTGLVAASFGLSAALYNRLPDPVPSHWDAAGRVNGYIAKPWGAVVGPLVMLGLCAALWIIPFISPRGYRIERFKPAFEVVQLSTIAFLSLIHGIALLAASGAHVSVQRIVPAAVGLLLVVLGNFMSKFTRNFFVGIRTPWTLASDEVWLRTHRLGGRLFVLAGAVVVLSTLLGGGPEWLIGAVAIAGIGSSVYSFVIYRRLEGRASEPRP
jgi:uncharacterized membrane protein